MAVDGISRIHAPAKVNLNLRITGRRDDGYHLLDSVVVFTSFGDWIELEPARADCVDVTGDFASSVGTGEDNICFRALAAYRDYGGVADCLSITIDKQIPVGAGLGGGSSDAAVILRYLNRVSPPRLPRRGWQKRHCRLVPMFLSVFPVSRSECRASATC